MTLLGQIDNLSTCPNCNNTDIEEREDQSGVDLHYRTFLMHCNECGHNWYEEYEFTRRIELNEA